MSIRWPLEMDKDGWVESDGGKAHLLNPLVVEALNDLDARLAALEQEEPTLEEHFWRRRRAKQQRR